MSLVEVIHLRSAALPSGARVLAFTGREEISWPSRFEVFVVVPHSLLDEAIGSTATLKV